MHTFVLFRRRSEAEFCCAVPEGSEVPRFLSNDTWEMSGRISGDEIDGDATWPSHFHAISAEACARVNGYYLFQSC